MSTFLAAVALAGFVGLIASLWREERRARHEHECTVARRPIEPWARRPIECTRHHRR